MKLPAYGKELLAARRLRQRPAAPVVVTDCWGVAKVYREDDLFALVCPQPAEPYDFALLYDLEVLVMTASDDILGLCERIAQAKPRRMSVLRRGGLIRVLEDLYNLWHPDPHAETLAEAWRQVTACGPA